MGKWAVLRSSETPGRARYRPLLALVQHGGILRPGHLLRFRTRIWCRACDRRLVQLQRGRPRQLCGRECYRADQRRQCVEGS